MFIYFIVKAFLDEKSNIRLSAIIYVPSNKCHLIHRFVRTVDQTPVLHQCTAFSSLQTLWSVAWAILKERLDAEESK